MSMSATDTTPAILWDDLRPVLDTEVGRLPDKYRVPVVLCYLGGKTYDEAAREIGCPKGTVATRLVKARRLLRERLSGRGVTLPAAGLAAMLAENARAALPAMLVHSTVETATTTVVQSAVAKLTTEVLRAMAGPKLKVVPALLVTAGFLVAGVGALAFHAAGSDRLAIAGDQKVPNKREPVVANEHPWGEPDAGIQIRIRPQQARGKTEGTLAFAIDVRNRGKMPTNMFPSVTAWEVEVDGVWYGRKMDLPPGTSEEVTLKPRDDAKAFKPDEEVKGWVTLRLDGEWLRNVRGEKRIRSEQVVESLPLATGRHTIRVAHHIHAGFCPVSNAVEITCGEPDDPGWIRVRTEAGDKLLAFRPDGTGRTETVAGPAGRYPSPDEKNIVYAVPIGNDSTIHVADADGKNARKVSPDGVVAAFPNWSPDGKRIAFLGTRGEQSHVYVMERDGRNVRAITDANSAPHGARLPKFNVSGQLAYLVLGERVGKRQPADLMIGEGKEPKVAVRGEIIVDYAWASDGKAIAYSRPGDVNFLDLASGKGQEISLKGIDERIAGHAAVRICWSPDGRAVACTLSFWGGRQAKILADGRPGINKMFGDDEVFVIPRTGKATWFQPGEQFLDVEWVWDKPASR
jgi:hypothetical protein